MTVPCNGVDVVPEEHLFRRDSKIRVTFKDGDLVSAETVNPLEDWPGWE